MTLRLSNGEMRFIKDPRSMAATGLILGAASALLAAFLVAIVGLLVVEISDPLGIRPGRGARTPVGHG